MAKNNYSPLTKFTMALSAMGRGYCFYDEGTERQTVTIQSDTEDNRYCVDFVFDGNGKLLVVETGENGAAVE